MTRAGRAYMLSHRRTPSEAAFIERFLASQSLSQANLSAHFVKAMKGRHGETACEQTWLERLREIAWCRTSAATGQRR